VIDSKGRLEIPLYHGTSSFFLDSIRENGLGGYRDPQLFNKKVLVSLVNALKKPENYYESWDLYSFVVEKMLKQEVTAGGFNFRYGNTYLSPSKLTASKYAKNNDLGSEFLSTINTAYKALKSVNPIEAEEIISSSSYLQAVLKGSHKPVLIEITNADTNKLRTEQGKHIHAQLDKMNSINNEQPSCIIDIFWQQYNFELEGVIDWSLLDIVYLD